MEEKPSIQHSGFPTILPSKRLPKRSTLFPQTPILLGICTPRDLPALTSEGILPEGIFDTTLDELRSRFATNPRRQEMWEKLLAFLSLAAHMGSFSHAYIGGSYVSNCKNPRDIDLVLHCRYPAGAEAFVAIEPFFAFGLSKFLDQYSVHLHFWIDGFPSITDFRAFFQQIRPEDAPQLPPPDDSKKGVVRLKFIDSETTGPLDIGDIPSDIA